jgi:bacterioferritin
MKEFLNDVEVLREKSREEIGRSGAFRGSESEKSTHVLNQALALNMVCVLRHMRHFVTADRFDSRNVAQEFLEHTVRESEHSDLIVARIRALGGEPAFERNSERSRGQFACDSLSEFEEFIRCDLLAEQLVISMYGEMIDWLADDDVKSRQLLGQILALEEEHAEVMLKLVAVVID